MPVTMPVIAVLASVVGGMVECLFHGVTCIPFCTDTQTHKQSLMYLDVGKVSRYGQMPVNTGVHGIDYPLLA